MATAEVSKNPFPCVHQMTPQGSRTVCIASLARFVYNQIRMTVWLSHFGVPQHLVLLLWIAASRKTSYSRTHVESAEPALRSPKTRILHKGHFDRYFKKNGSTLISRAKFDQDVILATVKCLGDYRYKRRDPFGLSCGK
jgi:hypothetical protein